MSTLHIFGDSFVQDHPRSWTTTLANLQSLEICNYALSGTSIEWSALKFQRRMQHFLPGDVVIFAMTSSDRFDIEPYVSKLPGEAYMAKKVDQLNDDNLEWYIQNRSQGVIDNKPTIYTSLIHTVSTTMPDVKFIVVSGFKEPKFKIVNKTENFIVVNDTSLNELSHYEVDEIKVSPHMLYNICGKDPRINHLSNPNLNILANIMHRVINEWDSSLFRKENFIKNVINKNVKTLDELYTTYVDSDIFDKHWVDTTKIQPRYIRKSLLDIFRR